jgi:tRNA-guanine family transglycosylase
MGKLVNFCAGAEPKKRPDNATAYLLNVPEYGSTPRRIKKAIKLQQETQPQHLMIDSGGFQLLNAEIKGWKITHDADRELIYKSPKEINLAPKHVMEFATKLSADIVIGLDFPVGKFKTAAEREIEFYKKLPLNVRWAHESDIWKRKLCPKAQLFLPVQGYTNKHIDEFFSRIAGIQYDGVAIPVREAKFHEIALFLDSFYQRGIGRVHLLGTASFQKIAMIAFMAHHMFDWVSLDAASWNKAAFHCSFLSPKNLKRVDLRMTAKLDPDILNDCSCPHCNSRSFTEIQWLQNKEKFELLRQHNWWAIDKAVRDLEKNSGDLVQLERFLKDRDVKPADIESLINTLALVDCLKDEDIEVLQTILAPIPKPGKLTRKTRKATSVDS